jgi:hypothetical protein
MVTDDVDDTWVGFREVQRRKAPDGSGYEALTHCPSCDVFWEVGSPTIEGIASELEKVPRCDCQWREYFKEHQVSREQQMLQMATVGMYTITPMRGVVVHVDRKENKVIIRMDGNAGVYAVPASDVLPEGPTGLWLENFKGGMS